VNTAQRQCRALIEKSAFDNTIHVVILVNAVVLGLGTF
jgi:hypothetical protein